MNEKFNKKYYLVIGVVALIVTTLAVSGFASAGELQNDKFENLKVKFQQQERFGEQIKCSEREDCPKQFVSEDRLKQRKMLQERQKNKNQMRVLRHNEVAREAMDNNDYEAWRSALPENCPMVNLINEQNFEKLIQAHNIIKQGNHEEAKILIKELMAQK